MRARSENVGLVPSTPGARRSKSRTSAQRTSARADECRSLHRRSPPRRPAVVHVRDRDARRAEQVEHRLGRRGFAEDVADERDLDGNPLIKSERSLLG